MVAFSQLAREWSEYGSELAAHLREKLPEMPEAVRRLQWWQLALLAVPSYFIARFLWELPKVSALHNKAVFITGCDTGFGRLLAAKCSEAGMPVFAGCLTEEAVASFPAASSPSAGRIVPLRLDITEQRSVDAAADTVRRELKEGEVLWAIVNNAGVFTIYGPDDWTTPDTYQRSFDVNCLGSIRVTQALKQHVKLCGGRIVSVSSVSGRLSVPFGGPYSVAKYGVEAYMDTIRQELRPWGVRCSLLEPGAFKTPLLSIPAMEKRVETVWNALPQATREEYGDQFKDCFVSSWNGTLHSLGSDRLHYVVDNYFHACVARHPRSRYHCGWDSRLFYIPLSFAPAWIQDGVFRFISEFNNKNNVKIAAIAAKESEK